jgi:hypothetical protein
MKINRNSALLISVVTISFLIQWFYTLLGANNYLVPFLILLPLSVLAIRTSSFNLKVKFILTVSFVIKQLITIINEIDPGMFSAPGKRTNAVTFHIMGTKLSKLNITEIFSSEYNYNEYWSSIIGLFYKFIGENNYFIIYINIILSLLTAIYVYKTVLKIKDEKSALWALGITSFFPGLLILSTVELRESVIIYFMMLSIYCFVLFIDKNKIVYISLAVLFIIISGIFHAGMLVLLLGYVFYLMINNINRASTFVVIGLFIVIGYFSIYFTPLFMNKAGPLINSLKNNTFSLDASYSKYIDRGSLKASNYRSQEGNTLTKFVIDTSRFLFYPFIPNPFYKFETLNGIMFILIVFITIRSKPYKNGTTLLWLSILLLMLMLVFDLSSGAYPQASRHKMKLIPLIAIIYSSEIRRMIKWR